MPFVQVQGAPYDTPSVTLLKLRTDIAATVSQQMGCPTKWVRPFFPLDMLDGEELPEDACRTIFVRVDTAMFHANPDEEKAIGVVTALAHLIWEAFDGLYEVEVFIGDLHNKWKCLLEPKSTQ